MKRLGIEYCSDLRPIGQQKLTELFGNFGERLFNLSHGIDMREVQTERIRKSVSVENTFAEDLPTLECCLNALPELEEQLLKRMKKLKDSYQIQKQFVKIKFHDFVGTTVEMLSSNIDIDNYIALCEEGYTRGNKPVRLLGMGVRLKPLESNSDAEHDINQLSLGLDA